MIAATTLASLLLLAASAPSGQIIIQKKNPPGGVILQPNKPGGESRMTLRGRELRCRGGGALLFENIGAAAPGPGGERRVTLQITFERGESPAGRDSAGLSKPGSCAFEAGIVPPEAPRRIRFQTFVTAPAASSGTKVSMGTIGEAAADAPDATSIPRYLKNSRHYWSFFVLKTNPEFFDATEHRVWPPPAEVAPPPPQPEEPSAVTDATATLEAEPNPVLIAAGEASSPTTLTWKTTGTVQTCGLYLRVDDGTESLVDSACSGTHDVPISGGKSYDFALRANGAATNLAQLRVTGAAFGAPPPSDAGSAAADLFDDVRVEPGDGAVLFWVTTAEPSEVSIQISGDEPIVSSGRIAGTELPVAWSKETRLAAFSVPDDSGARKQHEIALRRAGNRRFDADRIYHYVITAKTASGAYWRRVGSFTNN